MNFNRTSINIYENQYLPIASEQDNYHKEMPSKGSGQRSPQEWPMVPPGKAPEQYNY